jgi:hypothetical protein
MDANRLRRLMDLGFSVRLEKADGTVEKYLPCKSGLVAVSYSGPSVCMHCGRILTSTDCVCSRDIETLSMTGAFRFLQSMRTSDSRFVVDERIKTVVLTQKQLVS